jgi:hypothetical protein
MSLTTVTDHSPRPMKSVRLASPIILATGLAALLIMVATSIALDVRSRSEARRVNHTLEDLNQLTDLRLLLRQHSRLPADGEPVGSERLPSLPRQDRAGDCGIDGVDSR